MKLQSVNFGSVLRDVNAGFVVFLIALPLSLGIALASGFPPAAGILTAIVGGIICSFFGSAPLTIKGPAAGLIVIVLGAVHDLGMGDPAAGYRRTLAVGVVAALIQIVLSFRGAATLGLAMSPSVVHGMLAAIGVIIISKQSHTMLGVKPHGHEPLELLFELPSSILQMNPIISSIGLFSLVLLAVVPRIKFKKVPRIPAPLAVLLFAIPASLALDMPHGQEIFILQKPVSIGPQHLIQLPTSFLEAIVLPDFSMVWSFVSLKYVFLLALIGSIESVLTVLAVDPLDPEKRVSDLNKDLFATGVGNLVSCSLGGLPMISEIVRSKANIDSGARTSWANVSHGMFLAIFVALLPAVLSVIPLAALAAMLVFVGLRLASPSEFRHAKQVGSDQLFIFLFTFLLTIGVDLLVGVAAGLLLELVLHCYRGARFRSLFTGGIVTKEEHARAIISVRGPAVFTNFLKIRQLILSLRGGAAGHIVLDVSGAEMVDHTFQERISTLVKEFEVNETEILEVRGLGSLKSLSSHPSATRLNGLHHVGRE